MQLKPSCQLPCTRVRGLFNELLTPEFPLFDKEKSLAVNSIFAAHTSTEKLSMLTVQLPLHSALFSTTAAGALAFQRKETDTYTVSPHVD